MSTEITTFKHAVMSAKKGFQNIYGDDFEKIFNREAGNAILQISGNKYLQQCSPESIKKAVVMIAQTDLTLNPAMSLAYLTPRSIKYQDEQGKWLKRWEVVLMPSYMGFIEIIRRSGKVSGIRADVVYEGEPFKYGTGTEYFLNHTPSLDRDESKTPIGAYAVANFPDGSFHFEVKGWKWIMKRKAVSASGDKGPWKQWRDEMACKTMIRHIYKFLPKTPEINDLVQVYDTANPVNLENPGAPEITQPDALKAIQGAANPVELAKVWNVLPEGLALDGELNDAYNQKAMDFQTAKS